MRDPYTVLGVSHDASEAEIKTAYKTLAKKYHPDVTGASPEAASRMQEINAAYDEIVNHKNNYNPFQGNSSYANGNADGEDLGFQAAYSYIRNHRFVEAITALSGITNRNAKWYYLSAIAHAGINDMESARSHARTAAQMEPGNAEYQNLSAYMQNGKSAYQSYNRTYSAAPGGLGSLCLSLIMARLCCCFCI